MPTFRRHKLAYVTTVAEVGEDVISLMSLIELSHANHSIALDELKVSDLILDHSLTSHREFRAVDDFADQRFFLDQGKDS